MFCSRLAVVNRQWYLCFKHILSQLFQNNFERAEVLPTVCFWHQLFNRCYWLAKRIALPVTMFHYLEEEGVRKRKARVMLFSLHFYNVNLLLFGISCCWRNTDQLLLRLSTALTDGTNVVILLLMHAIRLLMRREVSPDNKVLNSHVQ